MAEFLRYLVSSLRPNLQMDIHRISDPKYLPRGVRYRSREWGSPDGAFSPQLVLEMSESADPPASPTRAPTAQPTDTATLPEASPTPRPTIAETNGPTTRPTIAETNGPTARPTIAETDGPTTRPTIAETNGPTARPTITETDDPTARPTIAETDGPTARPTIAESDGPTARPNIAETDDPTFFPVNTPAPRPTDTPVPSTPALQESRFFQTLIVPLFQTSAEERMARFTNENVFPENSEFLAIFDILFTGQQVNTDNSTFADTDVIYSIAIERGMGETVSPQQPVDPEQLEIFLDQFEGAMADPDLQQQFERDLIDNGVRFIDLTFLDFII